MRQYNDLSQRDIRWANQRLGTVDGATIGQYGCYVTSMAILADYYGKNITPADLDNDFTNKGYYVSGDLVADNDLQRDYGDITFVEADSFTSGPADLGKLQQLMNDPATSVILEIDFDHDPNDGIQTHFVVCNAFDGVNLYITDPWYGTTDNFAVHYGTDPAVTIQKFVVYKGTPVQGGANMYKGLDLTNQESMQVAVDAWYDVVHNQYAPITEVNAIDDALGLPHGAGKDAEVASIAKIKADSASKDQTIINLNKQIPDMENQIKLLNGDLEVYKPKADNYDQLKPLYDALESKYSDLTSAHGDLQQTANRQVGQLKNTSYTTTTTGTLVKEILRRFFHLK